MEEVFLKLALDCDKDSSWEREKKLKPIPENNTVHTLILLLIKRSSQNFVNTTDSSDQDSNSKSCMFLI